MTVEIKVNWTFKGADDEAHVSYRTAPAQRDEDDDKRDKTAPPRSRVVPLGSSVLAPGLSMPIPRR